MKLGHNTDRPLAMHIDLNSCFATVEQQARPMLRGKPVAIVNRRTDYAMIVTASYEAKAFGVKLGMRLIDAKKLCPGLIGIESDPLKYRYVYKKLLSILQDYSSSVTMKSIDEGVIDFNYATKDMQARDLVKIGYEIKRRLKTEIGCYMRCNVGIGTNRFLAKMAASLHKPDGLDVLTSHNIREIFNGLILQDLTGIAKQNEKRLNAVGIYTPLDLLDASSAALKFAFKSVIGEQWYQRLRGWEVDDSIVPLKSCGRQYVFESRHLTKEQQYIRLHTLVEGVGYKLRSNNKGARGVKIHARLNNGGVWSAHQLTPLPFFANYDIWQITKKLFVNAPLNIRMISVVCYSLNDLNYDQLILFSDEINKKNMISVALDDINSHYGEHTIHSGDTLCMGDIVKTKIPFASTRYLQ